MVDINGRYNHIDTNTKCEWINNLIKRQLVNLDLKTKI